MMRTLISIILFACSLTAQANESWLWRNANQRGDALLQKGDAAQAEKTYSDPRHRAYAGIRAGDYAAAIRELASLKDEDANYNRGIALAHTGELQGALSAFDRALKLNPKNQDARKNRELVAKALKQADENKPQNDKQGSKSENKKSDPTDQSKSGEQNKSKQNQENNNGQGKDGKSSKNNKAPEISKPAENKKPPEDSNEQAQSAAANQKTAEKPSASKNRQSAQADRPVDSEQHAANQLKTTTPPGSEKQLAQEQWLRSIPDDPGGLLRRKFLIEYTMRKQQP